MEKELLADALIRNRLVPWDKSWIIRLGILDLLRGYDDIFEFLNQNRNRLSDDLKSLRHALTVWKNGERNISVGESATLYRFLRFIFWVREEDRRLIKNGSLLRRGICDNSTIVGYSLQDLLRLDGGTSQWASAAYLCRYGLSGGKEMIDNPPEKLQITYDAVQHWEERRRAGECWDPRFDETIIRQSIAIIEMLTTGTTSFRARHSEDYCLARVFSLITEEEGKRLFPSVAHHESNRFNEMEEVISGVEREGIIGSKDHRAIQAGVVLQMMRGIEGRVICPRCVGKSWPEFWRFIEYVKKMSEED